MATQIQTLIVEDSRLDAKILQGLMAKSLMYDFDVSVVDSGEDAKVRALETPYDLMLLDLGLPDSSGDTTLGRLEQLLQTIPVIVLTGDDDIDLATKALQSGAQDYLVKGKIDLSTLEKAVRYAMERDKLRKQRDIHFLSLREAQKRTQNMLDALDKSNQQLEQEIARSRLLTTAIEQSVESVVITDVNAAIVYANKSFETVTGYSVSEAIGKNPRILKSGQHDDAFYRELWSSLTTRGTWSGRIKNKRKDGTIFEEEARISSVKNDAGEVVNYVAVKKDITHEAKLELQLIQARKLESIGQLAAGIAHEINTPSQYVGDNIRFLQEATVGFMTVLDKYEDIANAICPEIKAGEVFRALEKAKEDVDLSFLLEETPSAIAQSLDGIARISKIVLAMKEFSHPGTEQMTVNDINKALLSTVTVASNEWKYVATVETELQSNLPMIPCYMGEMNQVFLNIIVNAAHAIGDANVKPGKIIIRTMLEEPFLRVEIADNGTGIPEEIRMKIFDPFFTTKEVGKGTGQGLAMAFGTVVEKHHGKLLVESEVGKGTTFIILLPLLQAEEGRTHAE